MTAPKAKNTERLLYRERKGDPLADSLRLMRDGRIGIDCDVHIIILTLREWHALAVQDMERRQYVAPKRGAARTTSHPIPTRVAG